MYRYIEENLSTYQSCRRRYEGCKCTKCETYNFISMNPGRRYYIEDVDKLYSIVENSKETLTFLERRELYSQITLDYDKKEEGSILKKLISKEETCNLVKDFLLLLKKGTTTAPKEYISVTLFKKKPYIKDDGGVKYIKHGLHLQCIFLRANLDTRKKLISNIKAKWGKNVDDGSNNNWFLYRCGKSSSALTYKYADTFILDGENLVRLDTIKYVAENAKTKLTNLVKVFSTFCFNGGYNIEYKDIPIVKMEIINKNITLSDKTWTNEPPSLKLITEILDNISSDNYKEHDSCRNIVWTIKSLGFDEDLIQDYSRKKAENKHNPDWIHKTWNKCNNESRWNIGTLMNLLKESIGKKEYEKFCKANFSYTVSDKNEHLLFEDDLGLSELYVLLNGADVKITDDNGNGYAWDNKSKLWLEKSAIHIKNSIPAVIISYIESCIKNTKEMMKEKKVKHTEDSDDESEQEEKNQLLSKRVEYYTSIIQNLRKSKFLPGIFNHIISSLQTPDFKALLNKETNLLPIKNGEVINLETREIRKRMKNDMFTFECPVTYKPNINEYKNAIKFFTSISNYGQEFVDDEEKYDPNDMVNFFQKWLGYCLTGEVSDRSFYVCWGIGRNGKSTLVNILKNILGPYSQTCTKDALIKKERSSGATPELTPFIGSRIVECNETAEEDALNVDRMKALTGDDIIKIRELYQKRHIEIKPTSKILICTNAKPKLTEDSALKDRLKLVPFLASFENCKENRKYIEDIKTIYIDEIFSWLVEGAYKWYASKQLILPKIAEKERKDYIGEYDTFTMFIEAECEEGKEYKVQAQTLYNEYTEWCGKNDKPTITLKNFGIRIKQKYTSKRTSKCMFYVGLKLKE